MAEKKSKILRILCIIAAIVFLSYVIYILSLSIGVRRRISRLSAAGYPVTFAEFMERSPSSAEDERSALELKIAMERISFVYSNLDPELRIKSERGDPEALEITGEIILDNLDSLLEVREILKRSKFQYPASAMIKELLGDNYFQLYESIIRVVRLQDIALQYFSHTGRYDEAILMAEDMLRLTDSLDVTLSPIRALLLIRLAIHARGSLLMWEDSQTEELERMLDILVRAEEALMVNNQSIFTILVVIETMRQPELRSWPRVFSGSWHKEIIYYLNYCERMTKIEERAIEDRTYLIFDLYFQIKSPSWLIKIFQEDTANYDLIGLYLSPYGLATDILTFAQIRNARTAIATELFRRANGRWPESLEELVPIYLDEIPTDPCDGKPLRYRRMREGEEFRDERYGIVVRNGVIIYSVGPDGSDDGGTMGSTVNDIHDFFSPVGYDIVFPLGDIERIEKP